MVRIHQGPSVMKGLSGKPGAFFLLIQGCAHFALTQEMALTAQRAHLIPAQKKQPSWALHLGFDRHEIFPSAVD
jgi:hypothetical protein